MPIKSARHAPDRIPPPLPGFEHINRYWDDAHGYIAAKVLPGEYYVTRADELVVTVLGSCVSACIRDPAAGVGGMNHFMLPADTGSPGGSWDPGTGVTSTRYGTHAMQCLIDDIVRHGGARAGLEVKVFGGGRILAHMAGVGHRNAEFVRSYVEQAGLRMLASDLGGIHPRKVYYLPANGRVFVKRLLTLHNDTIAEREAAYLRSLAGAAANRRDREGT